MDAPHTNSPLHPQDLSDQDEDNAVTRYAACRNLSAAVTDAVRRADAALRLEIALRTMEHRPLR